MTQPESTARGRTRRTVLITGGSAGIGLATAELFAQAGHQVLICGRKADQLDMACARIAATSGGAIAKSLVMDVTEPDQVEGVLSGLAAAGIETDILVNNAGLTGNPTGVGSGLMRELRRSMEANLFAAALLCDQLLPGMIKRGWGRVVNVASTAALAAPVGQLPYSTSKGALVALTRALAVDVASAGTTVNAVAPGPVATESYRRSKGQAGIDNRALSIPSGRLAESGEVAATIAFLASEDAAHLNGQMITIDGGEGAAGPYAAMWVARRTSRSPPDSKRQSALP